jgi:uncharacterized protein YecE (DUF72 family)
VDLDSYANSFCLLSCPKMQLYVGCSGRSHDSWLGHFYPKHLESRLWIDYYSKVFHFVEIDPTFFTGHQTGYTTVRWGRDAAGNISQYQKV